MRGFLCVVAVVFLMTHAAFADATIVGQASVIDGDTIEIHGLRIRLSGIDAPESSQTCTTAAGERWRCGHRRLALALADRIARRTVFCTIQGRDRYDRVLARCTALGIELNRWLVQEGWAIRYYDRAGNYIRHEKSAAAAGQGMWSGTFIEPRIYRKTRE